MPVTLQDAIAKNVQGKQPGDYTGPDGLLYCGKCHTPKQCRVVEYGRDRLRPIACQCQNDERRNREEAEKTQKRYEAAMTLPICSIHDYRIKDWTFSSDDGNSPEITKKARRYVEHWDKVKEKGAGLLLLGGVGTGKSFMAACIANALMEHRVPVLYTSFGKLIRAVTNYTDDKNRYLQSLNRFDLLVLDDLGAERQSSFAMEQVFEVIDGRVKAGLPMIVSTNLTLPELSRPSDMGYARIYDRILSVCVPLLFSGPSRRKAEGADRLHWLKSVLEDE